MRVDSFVSMRSKLVCAVAAVLVVAGCGGAPGTATLKQEGGTDTKGADGLTVHGDASAPVNEIAATAIGDLQSYWAQEYPKLYGKDYQPVEGGFYSVNPSEDDPPPCTEDVNEVAGNAFYCSTEDVVAWDAEGLLPELQSKFGDFVIPIVFAHEWGHAVQARSDFTARTVTKELQADCFAGGAFQDGYNNGVGKCKDYRDDDPMVVELPFNDEEDAARGGDAPYDSIINGVPYDLEDYWTQVYPELTDGEAWVPVRGLEPFDPADPPMCGDSPAEGYVLFYCVPDDYIGWDNTETMPEVYRQGGDFAVATLLATQYALAAMSRANDQADERTQSLRGDCFAGAYTASVVLGNRSATSSYQISPGDLDEAITALLVFRGDGDAQRQGAGFERVRHYRDGVINGAGACLKDS